MSLSREECIRVKRLRLQGLNRFNIAERTGLNSVHVHDYLISEGLVKSKYRYNKWVRDMDGVSVSSEASLRHEVGIVRRGVGRGRDRFLTINEAFGG